MSPELTHLSFEEWIVHVFDHPTTGQSWYFALDADWWDAAADPASAIRYLTALFEDPVALLEPYTDAQINQGLWFLLDTSGSEHARQLANPQVPWADRARCVAAMQIIFADLLAPRCTPHLGHLTDGYCADVGPLNMVCYMWWDILPVSACCEQHIDQRDDQLSAACLPVMEQILTLNSLACRESALHGLGHWCVYHEDRVHAIIDAFLHANPDLPPELRDYAERARTGCVL